MDTAHFSKMRNSNQSFDNPLAIGRRDICSLWTASCLCSLWWFLAHGFTIGTLFWTALYAEPQLGVSKPNTQLSWSSLTTNSTYPRFNRPGYEATASSRHTFPGWECKYCKRNAKPCRRRKVVDMGRDQMDTNIQSRCHQIRQKPRHCF